MKKEKGKRKKRSLSPMNFTPFITYDDRSHSWCVLHIPLAYRDKKM